MRTRLLLTAFVLALLSIGVIANVAQADEKRLRATLTGYEEVPAVSSAAHGEFSADIDENEQVIRYSLTLSGTFNSSILFAHIHLGQRTANGNVVTFLCGGGTKPTPCSTTQPNTGEIRPADIGVTTQGIVAGEWDEFVRALRAGVTYANVHSMAPAGQPGGEIRGQINDRNQRNDESRD
jgi:CHRD domain-containing protein